MQPDAQPESRFVEVDPAQPQFDIPLSVSAAELIDAQLPPRELLIDPILPVKGLAMLYGPRGLGKTHVALGIAWAAAAGGQFLKWQAPEPRRVLYVDGEMPAADMQARLRLIGSAPDTLRFLLADMQDDPMPDLVLAEGQERLERSWDQPPDLLVIDNLSSLASAARDNDAESWSVMQAWLLKLRRPSNYEPKDGARFEIHMEKARGVFGDATEPFEARLQTDPVGTTAWTWTPVKDAEFERAVELFNDGVSAADAAEALGVSRATAFRMKKRALNEGRLNE